MAIGKSTHYGFTYIGLLIAIAFFGLSSVGMGRLLISTERIEAEAELLFVGRQFQQAIGSYLQSGTDPKKYPTKLDDLLIDPRYPNTRRHLRKIFFDPITKTKSWGLVLAPDGGIMGVYSLSGLEPLKRTNFELQNAQFAEKTRKAPTNASVVSITTAEKEPDVYSYRDWKFTFQDGSR